jgi:hypothetical protein
MGTGGLKRPGREVADFKNEWSSVSTRVFLHDVSRHNFIVRARTMYSV